MADLLESKIRENHIKTLKLKTQKLNNVLFFSKFLSQKNQLKLLSEYYYLKKEQKKQL